MSNAMSVNRLAPGKTTTRFQESRFDLHPLLIPPHLPRWPSTVVIFAHSDDGQVLRIGTIQKGLVWNAVSTVILAVDTLSAMDAEAMVPGVAVIIQQNHGRSYWGASYREPAFNRKPRVGWGCSGLCRMHSRPP